ncbi:MotA/TolQ/ExbB proton channel family protein [Blastopirellula marina]|nr:MotA/TolQ/ExbB proton channel family protein [Blastopirellula marina]
MDLPPLESSGFPSFDDGGGAGGNPLGGLDLGNLQTDPLSTKTAAKAGGKKGAATPPPRQAAAAASSASSSDGEFTDPSDVGLVGSGIFGFFAAVTFLLLLWPSKGTYIGDLFLAGGFQGVMIQFLSTFMFFWAMAILWKKNRKIKRQRDYLLMDVLPTDISPEIRFDTLDRFVDNIRQLPGEHGESFLINRVLRGLQHFRVRRNAAETVTMMASQSEIDSNNVASSYTAIKVLIWAIPTMGFIGTVLGISLAVASLAGALGGNDPSQLMTSLTSMFSGLGTAFNTTLVALVMSMIIKFPMSSLQKSEEGVLNWVDEYCNENLLRRLNDGREGGNEPTGPLDTKIFRRAVEEAMAAQQSELEVWIQKLELVGHTITKQTTEGWTDIQAKLLEGQKEITAQVLDQMQAKTGEMQTRQEEQRAEMQDQLTQMQEIAAQLQSTLGMVANVAAQSSNQMNANVAASTERLEDYFSGVERGLTGLNEVLSKLGNETVVVQQVEAPSHGGGWFGMGGGKAKSRRNGKR